MGAVIVETFRESDGALLVATARGGSGLDPSSTPPFAFERATDGRFIASLWDGDADCGEATAASRGGAPHSAVLVVVADASVQVGWVGALEVIVLRQGEVAHRTIGMASPRREPGVDLAGPWRAEPGDLVLLCSVQVHQVLSEADVAALANRDDIATIVRGLVTTTSTRGNFSELCAVAIRIVAL